MSKPKYSPELKIEIAKAYLSGQGSYAHIAKRYEVGQKSVKDWVRRYREQGDSGFFIHTNTTN